MPIPIHGPDHCPTGPDPIPCIGVEWGFAQFTTDQTVTTGTSGMNPGFDEIYVPSGQTTLIVNPDGSADNVSPFYFTSPCIMGQSARVQFTDLDWTDIRRLAVRHTASIFGPEAETDHKGVGTGQGSTLFYSGTPQWLAMGGSAVDTVKLEVVQTSGSNKTLTAGRLMVVVFATAANIGDMTPFNP